MLKHSINGSCRLGVGCRQSASEFTYNSAGISSSVASLKVQALTTINLFRNVQVGHCYNTTNDILMSDFPLSAARDRATQAA